MELEQLNENTWNNPNYWYERANVWGKQENILEKDDSQRYFKREFHRLGFDPEHRFEDEYFIGNPEYRRSILKDSRFVPEEIRVNLFKSQTEGEIELVYIPPEHWNDQIIEEDTEVRAGIAVKFSTDEEEPPFTINYDQKGSLRSVVIQPARAHPHSQQQLTLEQEDEIRYLLPKMGIDLDNEEEVQQTMLALKYAMAEQGVSPTGDATEQLYIGDLTLEGFSYTRYVIKKANLGRVVDEKEKVEEGEGKYGQTISAFERAIVVERAADRLVVNQTIPIPHQTIAADVPLAIPIEPAKEKLLVKDRSWKTLIDNLGIRWGG